MAVDPLFAQWLLGDAYWQAQTDATLASRWGATALTTSRLTTIASQADAIAEAQRQIAFLGGGGPLAIEEHTLQGKWRQYIGQVIELTVDRLGYDAGLDVFLIGAQDNPANGLSTLTVIRRL